MLCHREKSVTRSIAALGLSRTRSAHQWRCALSANSNCGYPHSAKVRQDY